MAKWSGVYLEDCHKLLKKIEKKLEKVVDEGFTFSDGGDSFGRYDLAKELQDKIKKWRREMFNEEGVREIPNRNRREGE
jgi:hypothetical protein